MSQPAPTNVLAVGDSGPRPDDHRPEAEMVHEFIDRDWNGRDLHAVEKFWVRDLVLHTIGYRTWTRPEGYRRALLQMLRPFPAAASRCTTSRRTTTSATRACASP